jgi:prepilin signal peptidase PulO-like enzyme (type II secretory pathway)
MIVATFIDFDEKTIPDQITVPGTLAALALAALLPATRLPVNANIALPFGQQLAPAKLGHLLLSSSHDFPAWLSGNDGLLLGLAYFLFWVFAIMPFVWRTRRGIGEALRLLMASFCRPRSRPYLLLAAVGCVLVGLVWRFGNWPELMSALAGMVFGGALIWAVRIVGTHALRVEAMGYGDVLLMFMIGAFLGWQPVLVIFFLAPFAALAIGVAQLVITRRTDIAFGPYLCLGTLVLIVGWEPLWNGWAVRIFAQFGVNVLLFLAVGLALMGVMLLVWRKIKERFLYGKE